MRCAADFRAEARAALKGRWGLAIGIGFLAMVLGGIAGVGGLDVNFVMVEGNFQMTLDIFGQRLNPVEMMRNIGVGSAFLVWQYLSVAAALVAIVRLIVGSFVGVGYMKFNLDLIDGEEGRLETLFRYVKQWGTMLAAVLLQAVYIIGWTLLFIIPGLIAAYRYQLTGYILAENPEMANLYDHITEMTSAVQLPCSAAITDVMEDGLALIFLEGADAETQLDAMADEIVGLYEDAQ